MFDSQGTTLKEMSSETRTILIADDDDSIGQFLELAILQETPYKPLVVATAEQAVATALDTKPDLFILDYYLGHMNGLELYDQLHAYKELETTPAIILTASLEKHLHEINRRQLVGLAKPLELDDLILSIERSLNNCRTHQ